MPQLPGYFFNGASRSPSWSPDGQKIAFAGPVICPNNMDNNIWTMNADGSAKTNLNNDNGSSDLRPAFSPDGTRIIFESNRDANGSPTLLDARGWRPRRLRDNAPDHQLALGL